jgi:hypothetical protein
VPLHPSEKEQQKIKPYLFLMNLQLDFHDIKKLLASFDAL